ncbi:acylneuraminate cytidylyltransferase family protein [Moraxella bovis]|uniref:acylneuraminate cytidylyltransferase family protein n=1 Tax=Moraxella bovis TaxID=476 RepID=UPI000DC78F9C|nr:acylneuraminate cytidylyltransferase family protein [Moraxella bovis]AWY19182.1 acylneuraminate cytidylyltransferase family protein [Moraxella bovis]
MSELAYIAVVPARGGSKGIQDKNLQMVGGVSLVARAIVEAQKVAKIRQIIVSTDSQTIADEAVKYGATVHFRSETTASDTAKTIEVIEEMVQDLHLDDAICVLLQPTSPLRLSEHILQTIDLFEKNNQQGSAITVTPSEHHPYKMVVLDETGDYQAVRDWTDLEMPRQALPKAFCINGAVYVKRFTDLVAEQSFFGKPQAFVQMDEKSSIDIDNVSDLVLANQYFENR